jgi:hypothetical protein
MEEPVYIGPLMAYKVLEFSGVGEDRVVSPYRQSHRWWPEKSVEQADCRLSDSRRGFSHKVPSQPCSCGYYGYVDLDDALACRGLFRGYGIQNFYFVVLVAGWGDVVTHKTGFRSQYMDVAAVHDGPYQYRNQLEKFAWDLEIPMLNRNELMDFASEQGTILTEDTLP